MCMPKIFVKKVCPGITQNLAIDCNRVIYQAIKLHSQGLSQQKEMCGTVGVYTLNSGRCNSCKRLFQQYNTALAWLDLNGLDACLKIACITRMSVCMACTVFCNTTTCACVCLCSTLAALSVSFSCNNTNIKVAAVGAAFTRPNKMHAEGTMPPTSDNHTITSAFLLAGVCCTD